MAGPYYEQGRYWGKLKAQGMGESKEKKTPFFAASFDILGRVNLQDPQGELPRCPQGERTVYLYITDKTVDRVIEQLAALGYSKPGFRFLDPETAGFVDLSGNEVALFCEHEEYQGKMKEKWGIHQDRGRPTLEPLDQKGLKALDNLYGKQLKALAKPEAEAAAAPKAETKKETVPPNGDIPDDDIPF